MNASTPNLRWSSVRPQSKRAFTLVEMMVAIGALAVIITGLMAVFHQVTRAFRLVNTQTDVEESGRLVLSMLERDLREANFEPVTTDITAPANILNFCVTNYGSAYTNLLPYGITNTMHKIFFLRRENNRIIANGYYIDDRNRYGYGTLYRFEDWHHSEDTNRYTGSRRAWTKFTQSVTAAANGTNWSRITDGLIHLQFRLLDRAGGDYLNPYYTNSPPLSPQSRNNNLFLQSANGVAYFYRDELPAFVEIEMGVLEPEVLKQVRAMQSTAQIKAFLQKPLQTGKVHLYRQRIPIHNATY